MGSPCIATSVSQRNLDLVLKKTLKDSKSFREKTMALKFRERLEKDPLSSFDSQEIDAPDLVKNIKIKMV
jgi:hypothetical protein